MKCVKLSTVLRKIVVKNLNIFPEILAKNQGGTDPSISTAHILSFMCILSRNISQSTAPDLCIC